MWPPPLSGKFHYFFLFYKPSLNHTVYRWDRPYRLHTMHSQKIQSWNQTIQSVYTLYSLPGDHTALLKVILSFCKPYRQQIIIWIRYRARALQVSRLTSSNHIEMIHAADSVALAFLKTRNKWSSVEGTLLICTNDIRPAKLKISNLPPLKLEKTEFLTFCKEFSQNPLKN